MNWSSYWLGLLCAIVVAFAVPEYHAIKNKQTGDTLTENIRLWFRTDTPGGGWSWAITWSALATVTVWLLGHVLRWWQ